MEKDVFSQTKDSLTAASYLVETEFINSKILYTLQQFLFNGLVIKSIDSTSTYTYNIEIKSESI